MKIVFLLAISLFTLNLTAAQTGSPGGESRRVEAPEKAAETAALKWLQLLDGGDYTQTWKTAARLLRDGVSERKWRSTMRPVREPLAKASARTLKSAERTTEVPGAPEGDYVVLTYDTTFEKKSGATEKLTMVNDKDGQWRVASYTVK